MQPEMRIVGYSDRWSVSPSQTITFFVSTPSPRFSYRLVRLGHGHDGPGTIAVPGFDGECDGMEQPILPGSSMRVEGLRDIGAMTFAAWIWPTFQSDNVQCFASLANADAKQASIEVGVVGDGRVRLSVGGRSLLSQKPIPLRQWTFVAATVSDSEIILEIRSKYPYAQIDWSSRTVALNELAVLNSAVLCLGAAGLAPVGCGYRTERPFNGKISAPALYDRALDERDIDRVFLGHSDVDASTLARWDFVADAGTNRVPDVSGNGFHGVTYNRPGRLVTGHSYSGRSMQPSEAPSEYNAAYFHDDDLSDAGWEPSFEISIPTGLKSGVYAAMIVSEEGDVDYLPFAVCPPKGTATSRVAMLLPTLSYMVYGNEGFDTERLPRGVAPKRADPVNLAERSYCRANRLRSLYDFHSDGSGTSMATMLRPVTVSFRPDFAGAATGSGHQLSADLQLLDWLEAVGIEYDVITDHELHFQGAAALAPYKAVLTGTHAEYWSEAMLDGLQNYQDNGGRFVYLSGNGLYWVTALSNDGTLTEIRRPQGTRPWSSELGEICISLTGEVGGLWRHRGRPPQKLVGVGFAAQGWDTGKPFVRHPASHDPRVSFIFEGIGDHSIGDFPAIALEHGPAGFEFDRADFALGTPPHALILATATGFSDAYQNSVEEVEATGYNFGGTTCSRVRADMVFFETPNDGAVFSGSSINFCSTLSYNNYENNVSRMLMNVVRAFERDGPLPNR